jgi:lipopolysaccharide export system protein LptA
LYDRSLVTSKDGTKTITADTLFYNRQTGFAEAFGNMLLNDTVKKAMLTGHYGYYDELKNFAFAADSAQFIECSQADTLFLHADTLQMKTIGDDRIVDAYYGVRFFREDIQGVCDSMHYDTRESMLYMLRNPVMWNTGYQISGDTVKILFNDSTLNKFLVRDRAFAMEEIDSTYCNQIKGRFLTGYFDDGKLSRVEIEGATESIYYPIEEKKMEFIGRNKTESTYMTIFVKDGKIREIRWKPEPKGEMLPLPDLTPEQKFLNEFVNFNYLRPKNKDDIFTVIPMKTEDTPAQKRRIRQIIN